jgi:hypothetical protein
MDNVENRRSVVRSLGRLIGRSGSHSVDESVAPTPSVDESSASLNGRLALDYERERICHLMEAQLIHNPGLALRIMLANRAAVNEQTHGENELNVDNDDDEENEIVAQP